MDTVHLVVGATGEYSDRGEWMVAAFSTAEAAQAYIERLRNLYQQFPQERCGYQRPEEERGQLEKTMTVLDPSFSEDYTGTYWYYDTVEWRG